MPKVYAKTQKWTELSNYAKYVNTLFYLPKVFKKNHRIELVIALFNSKAHINKKGEQGTFPKELIIISVHYFFVTLNIELIVTKGLSYHANLEFYYQI